MAPTDEQRDQAWQDRYTRQAVEADGRWSDDDFAALAALGAERDEKDSGSGIARVLSDTWECPDCGETFEKCLCWCEAAWAASEEEYNDAPGL